MLTRFMRYTATILIVFLLQACGGSSTSSVPTVSGVAATGAAIDGTVTLKDSTGATRTATISQPSGAFSIDVSGLTPPYFLKATHNAGTLTLYSIATGSGTFNINPLSSLVIVAAAMGIDPLAKTPDAAFNNPANFSTLTAAQIQAATDSVMSKMSPAFKTALAANDASNVNPLTDSYQIGNGLDKVFDGFVVVLNTATGEVQELQICGQTSTPARTATLLTGTLIITANPAYKTYDGNSYIGGNGVSYEGFVNGDTPAVLGGTLTYGGTSQGALNAGTYTIIPNGLTSSNYNIVYVDSTLTVTPATLTLTVINTSNIYNSGAVTLASGETLTLTGNETIGSLAGTGNLNLGAFTLTVGGDNTDTTFSGSISGTGGLTKVGTGTLTLTAANIYIGTINVLDGGLIVNGTALADTNSLTVATGATLAPGVGTIVSTGTITSAGVGGLTAPTNVQITPGAVINWQSFNICPVEVINFAQPSASGATLNQVTIPSNYVSGTLITNSGNILLNQAGGVLTDNGTNFSVFSVAGTNGATINAATLSAGP